MRTDTLRRTLCADCTARYATETVHRSGTCQHSSDTAWLPLRRADTDVPADSLDRSPRVSIVELAQLFVQGRDLYRALTARAEAWSLNDDQRRYLYPLTKPWGGVTYKRDGGTIDVRDDSAIGGEVRCAQGNYAVAIRPRGADPVSVSFDDTSFDALTDALRTFTTRAPFIGVFRDELKRTIDVDPVAIVQTRREADALGVYCGSTGGAYCFANGLGYWAPVL